MSTQDKQTAFIGIDAGATKTHAVLVTAKGDIIAEVFGPPVSMSLMSPNEAWARLRAVIIELTEKSAVGPSVAGIHAGIPGCFSPVLRKGLAAAMQQNPLPNPLPPPVFDTDCRIALAAAIPVGPGLLIVAGTGSSIYGRGPGGSERLFGGWGHLLGDTGSAFSIGLQALQICCRYEDGLDPITSMYDAILKTWSLDSLREAVTLVYGDDFKSRIASLAILVASEADHGDEAALRIYKQTAIDLAELASAAARGLGLTETECRVALSGSLWNAGSLIFDPFENALLHAIPHAVIIQPNTSPAHGAASLAMRESPSGAI